MGHERQILDEATGLSLGRITRAQHAPLTRLEGPRAGHFARLFKLGRNARHHPQRRDERQAREDVGDARAFHLEPLEGPVARRDGADEPLGDAVAVELELLDGVEFRGAVGLFENLVNVGLEVVVELFE